MTNNFTNATASIANTSYNSIDTLNLKGDTLFVSIITLSIIGFFILFFIVGYLPAREALLKEGFEDIKRLITDPCYGFLKGLSSATAIGVFLLCSVLYLISILVALADFFWFKKESLLSISIAIDFISTGIVACLLIIILIRAKMMGKADKKLQWLKGENKKEKKS